MRLLRAVFEELDVDFEEATGVKMIEVLKSIKHTIYKDLLVNGNSSKGIIESSLETMNRMAVNRLLDREYDYDSVLDGDGDLVLRLKGEKFGCGVYGGVIEKSTSVKLNRGQIF